MFQKVLAGILAWVVPPPTTPEFQFAWSAGAAQHNQTILEKYDGIWIEQFSRKQVPL
jgi:hypothetical protein